MKLNTDDVKKLLPQREPFLFVDEVVDYTAGDYVIAQKYIDPAAAFFKGHFPGMPIMPGVLTVEALAQTAIILYALTKPEIAETKPDYFLGKVKIDFKAPVMPRDTLTMEVRVMKLLQNSGVVSAEARVGETVVASGTLFFGVRVP